MPLKFLLVSAATMFISTFAFAQSSTPSTQIAATESLAPTTVTHQSFLDSLPLNGRLSSDQIVKLITHKPVIGRLTQGGFADPTFQFLPDGKFKATNGSGEGKWSIEKDSSGGDILQILMPSWPFPDSKSQVWVRAQKIVIGRWFIEK